MKWISKTVNIVLFTVMILTLTAAIGSAITAKPFLLTAVRSNSMYPLFQRSDMIALSSLSSSDNVKIGDIVVFKSEEGSLSSKGWVVHRIVSGNDENGYITQGDANEFTDQVAATNPPIKREWMASRVIEIGDSVVKLPFAGYLPLFVEEFHSSPYALPLMAVLVAVIIGVSELKGGSEKKKKSKRKSSTLGLTSVYAASGLTIAVIVAGTMISTSQHINVVYEISDKSEGLLMGSDIGILKTGDTQEKELADLQNNSFFPITVAITDNDPQISESHTLLKLRPGDSIKTTMKLEAKKPGNYQSAIWVGLFYPFLPSTLIYKLSSYNYWLALVAVSLVPGLPLMIYPLFDSKVRRKSKKEIRQLYRRILRKSFIFNKF